MLFQKPTLFLFLKTVFSETIQVLEQSPIQEDGTIRFPGFPDMCVQKRFLDYKSSQEVFAWPCSDINSSSSAKQGKLKWAYNSTTGLVKSIGSEEMRPTKPFCWNLVSARRKSQKLKIKACDENDPNQKFDFDANGRFVPRFHKKLCVSYDMNNSDGIISSKPLKINKCWGTNLMRFSEISYSTTVEPATIIPTTSPSLEKCGEINVFDPSLQKCCNTTVGYQYVLPVSHSCDPEYFKECNGEFYQPNFLECCAASGIKKLTEIGACGNCEIGFHFDTETFTCQENVCQCDGGIPARSRNCGDSEMNPENENYDPDYNKCCLEHDSNRCIRCSNGYTVTQDWTACIENQCVCENGVVEDRHGKTNFCPSDGFLKCKSCDEGFEMITVFDEVSGFDQIVCEEI